MTQPRRLRNPPIVETILDVRADLPDSVTLDGLAMDQLPGLEPFERQEIFPMKERGLPSGRHSVGFRYRSQEHGKAVDFRLDGFAFSKVPPYTAWDDFRKEAARFWDVYSARTDPAPRMASLRYVNRIVLPGSDVDLERYLRTLPRVAPELPQSLEGYFVRLELPFPDQEAHAVITQALDRPDGSAGDETAILLDIFIYKKVGTDLWAACDDLNGLAEKVFFGSITEEAEALFS